MLAAGSTGLVKEEGKINAARDINRETTVYCKRTVTYYFPARQ